jgi:hypothetical protein
LPLLASSFQLLRFDLQHGPVYFCLFSSQPIGESFTGLFVLATEMSSLFQGKGVEPVCEADKFRSA